MLIDLMEDNLEFNRRTFLKIAGIAAASAGIEQVVKKNASAESNYSSLKKTEKPDWEIGYRWNFYLKEAGKEEFEIFRKFSRVDTFEGTKCYVLRGGGGREFYLTEDMGPRAYLNKGALRSHCDPERRVFDWPLHVGKEWHKPYTFVIEGKQGKRNYRRDGHFKVVAFEDFETEAGTFKAYKLREYTRPFTEDKEERITSTIAQYWYSPEVKWLLKEVIVAGGYSRALLKSYSHGKHKSSW